MTLKTEGPERFVVRTVVRVATPDFDLVIRVGPDLTLVVKVVFVGRPPPPDFVTRVLPRFTTDFQLDFVTINFSS